MKPEQSKGSGDTTGVVIAERLENAGMAVCASDDPEAREEERRAIRESWETIKKELGK